MIGDTYEYLHPYSPKNYPSKKENWRGGNTRNLFRPETKEEVLEAEKILKTSFPSELKEFYLEIGSGYLTRPFNPPPDYDFDNSNEILPPIVAAHFYQCILEHQKEPKEEAPNWEGDYWMALSTVETLKPGDLPFFEISDSSGFMVMKLHSSNPNAVWFMGSEKIENSFEHFIWKLYHDGPSYYTKNW